MLYNSIPSVDRIALRQGLGRKIIESLRDHEAVLSAEALRRRDHSGDLGALVSKIIADL